MRKPPATHAKTLRGFSIFQNTVLYHESDLERRFSTYLQLRKDVKAIYSQYPVLLHRDADEVWREHTCDYCVVFEDGHTVAVAVKHARKTASMDDLIARIKAEGFLRKNPNGSTTSGAVHDIRLITERNATYGVYENALRILRARRMRDDAEYDRALEIVQTLTGRFRFGELLRNCSDNAKRRTALLLLIDEGVVVTETSGPIDDLTMLMVRR